MSLMTDAAGLRGKTNGGGNSGGGIQGLKDRLQALKGRFSRAPGSSGTDSSSGGDSGGGTGASGETDSYHSGGRVKRTGLARLKRGEVVLTKKQAREMRAKGRKGGRGGSGRR